MNPFSANGPNSRLADDVASADWLILDRRWDRPTEPNLIAYNGPDRPNEIVRTQFEPVTTFQSYMLLRKKGAQGSDAR